MTVTTKGYQGTITDADMATMYPHHVPTVAGAGDLLVTAVNGVRRVSVAAGSAFGPFLKYTSDAAQPVDLAPPSSGGKWYALTIDRQWSPTNAATLRADDLAVSNDGTVPTMPTAAVLAALAALPNQPGTAGSTAGQRQLLSLAHVRAADTTVTLFDLRARVTGAGTIGVPSLHALAALAPWFGDGAVVSVGQFTTPGGFIHRSSQWTRTSGAFIPTPGADILMQGIATANALPSLNDVLALINALGLSIYEQVSWGTAAGIRHRFNGTAWRPWDSDWIGFTGGWGGLAGSLGASPGWVSGGRYRYTAGKVRHEFQMFMNGGAASQTGTLSLTQPVAMDTSAANGQRLQDGYAVTGRAWLAKASNGRYFDVAIRQDSTQQIIYFGVVNSAQYMDGLSGLQQSDSIKGVIEYDPA